MRFWIKVGSGSGTADDLPVGVPVDHEAHHDTLVPCQKYNSPARSAANPMSGGPHRSKDPDSASEGASMHGWTERSDPNTRRLGSRSSMPVVSTRSVPPGLVLVVGSANPSTARRGDGTHIAVLQNGSSVARFVRMSWSIILTRTKKTTIRATWTLRSRVVTTASYTQSLPDKENESK